MGYYSTVVLGIAKAKITIDLIKATERCDRVTMRKSDGAIAFIWDGTKWYDSYNNVSFIMDYINDLEYDEYSFLRIGEELGDVEESGHLDLATINTTYDLFTDKDTSIEELFPDLVARLEVKEDLEKVIEE